MKTNLVRKIVEEANLVGRIVEDESMLNTKLVRKIVKNIKR